MAKSELERNILLFNDGEEDFEGRWDGKDLSIEAGESIEIQAGVAEHFQQRYPDAELRIEEIDEESTDPRTPGNPLETNNRGEAFGKLKKPPKDATE